MIKIRIVNFGRGKVPGINSGIEEFANRLGKLLSVERLAVDARHFSAFAGEQRKKRESQHAKELFKEAKPLVLLDGSGKCLSTEELANRFSKWEHSGSASIVFGIGGALGWDKELLERADFVLSLSPLTFTSQLAELVLIEQLYRVQAIRRGLPYHKE